MRILFDTAALSEMTKPVPNLGYRSWLESTRFVETFVGTPSIGEIDMGIRLLEPSTKRTRLERWLADVLTSFGDRIIPFDLVAARAWSVAAGNSRLDGKPLPVIDSQLAAIAFSRGLAVVTRNERHFQLRGFEGLEVLNPWS